jgi:multidrug resistance efflux pump
MKRRWISFLLPGFALGMLVFALWHVVSAQQALPPASPPRAPLASPFRQAIYGVGLVEAATENVSIGTALPGIVLEVYVPAEQVGRRVEAGQPLFRVDDRALKAQVERQRAVLAAAQAALAKLRRQPRPEELPPSKARAQAAAADVKQTADELGRVRAVAARGVVTAQEVVAVESRHDAARQRLAQASAEYALLEAGAWQPDKDIAVAAVAEARAQLQVLETEVERCIVRAPLAGDVLKVNVRPGEHVSSPAAEPLVVLGDLSRWHVRVDIDEADISRFAPGARAEAAVRGDASRQAGLEFVRVEPYVVPKRSLTGDSLERTDTRVLQAIYRATGAPGRWFVGQQVDVYIDAQDAAPMAR